MSTPYTLTLHETKHPDRPVTFALDGDTFYLDISALFGPEVQPPAAPPKDPFDKRMELVTQEIIAPFSGPAHIRDVSFFAQGDAVTLQIWKRTQGLRLAPITISISGIDDPEGAADFAARVKENALAATHPGKYTGPLDYWGSWILMGLGAASALLSVAYWLSRRCCDEKKS